MKRQLLLMLSAMALLFGCNPRNDTPYPEDPELEEGYLKVSTEYLGFTHDDESKTFTVLAGSTWKVYLYIQDPMLEQTPDWLEITPETGKARIETEVTVKPSANISPGQRECTIAVENVMYNYVKYIRIVQEGKPTSEQTAYLTGDRIVSNTYPEVHGTKTTVESDVYGLWFYGWDVSEDKRFTMSFPSDISTFGKVIMTYRMGCGEMGGSGYDHNTNIALKYNGEWFEIASCITPFGNSFTSTFEKEYYFDVTEYLPMLKGNVEFKIYFGGFDASRTGRHHTAKLTFDFYECTRDNDMIFVQRLYDSEETDNSGYRSWLYGREGESIEEGERFSNRTITVPTGVRSLKMKVTITGHGADQGVFLDRSGYQTKNAAEFDYNYYTVKVNGIPCSQKGYIFASCKNNYSQSGTCYYDRANWCPGNPAHTERWKFVNIGPGDTFDLDIDLERFQSEFTQAADGQATYRVHVDLFGFSRPE